MNFDSSSGSIPWDSVAYPVVLSLCVSAGTCIGSVLAFRPHRATHPAQSEKGGMSRHDTATSVPQNCMERVVRIFNLEAFMFWNNIKATGDSSVSLSADF